MFRLILGLLFFTLNNYAKTTAFDLKVGENFENPIGYHDASPSFSWKLPEAVTEQTAYDLELKDTQTDKVIWSTGWIDSSQSIFIAYEGEPLESRQQLSWKVRVKDQSGQELDWSESATFELGLLSKEDWSASWIRPKEVKEKVSASTKEVIIHKATFVSTKNDKRQADVTETLRTKLNNNRLRVKVASKDLNADPHKGAPKKITVSYSVGGEEREQTLSEGYFLNIPKENPREKVATMMQKVELTKEIAQARLYITAKGMFDFTVNDQRIGDDFFANGWTSYSKRIDSLTYDITSSLKSGENTLTARLASGWYAGRITWKHNRKRNLKPELLAQIEVTYKDGEKQTFATDSNWKGTFDGPVVSSAIYEGEDYDANQKIENWQPVIAKKDLGKARIQPKPFAPTKVTKILKPVSIDEVAPGIYRFDFRQNMVGIPHLRLPVEANKVVEVNFSEMLNPGEIFYTKNYRSARSSIRYTPSKSETIDWKPSFTFFGFRYIQVSGLKPGLTPDKKWIDALVLHTEMEHTGTFTSDHKKLNQLQSNITWGQRGNFLDIPTDCPQRDERLGWTGDAQVFASTSIFNFDCLAFWKSWLESVRDDQKPDGAIPNIVPSLLGAGSPGWHDAGLIIPWNIYIRTGDLDTLAENYEMMKKAVGFYRNLAKDHLVTKSGFGDWLQPHGPAKGETAHNFIATAFYGNAANILAKTAERLGKESDAEKFGQEAQNISKAFTEHYFDDNGKIKKSKPTQTAYLLALEFDLLPEELRKGAAEGLVEMVKAAGNHLRTGFLGTPYLNKVLDRFGYSDLAAEVLFKETYPSWFYSINNGATTIWERWNSYSVKTGFNAQPMNSLNHYAYGAVGEWIYDRVAGLGVDPENPGYKHFFIKPLFVSQLNEAKAELQTQFGLASSSWKKEGGKATLKVTVPPNTSATVILPGDSETKKILSGDHTFTIDLN